jgi:alpha-1,2-mannosyltransferase
MRNLMTTATAQQGASIFWQRCFLVAICVVFIGLAVQYGVKAAGSGDRANRSAFLRWRDQLQHLESEDIYQRHNFPYPPIMAMILEPLMHVPPLAGSLGWFLLKLGMTVLAFTLVFRLVETIAEPFPPWAKAVTVMLSLRPITGDLSHGNINLFILLLVVAALFAFHRRKDWLAGIVLALGIACKVTPALFVPYLLWKRAWKSLWGCALGLVVFLVLVPGLRFGFERNLTLLRHWADNMVAPFVVQGTVTSDHLNQSLPGLVFRLMTHNPSGHDPLGLNPEYENFVTLDQRQAGWLIKGCMLAFAGVIIWSCRTSIRTRQGWRLAAEYSLVILGMLLFSERTWKHHCVTLMIPFAVLSYFVAVCRPAHSMRYYLLGSLAAVVLLMTLTSTPGFGVMDNLAQRAEVYGAYVWAYLVLIGALVAILRSRREAPIRTEAAHSRAECARTLYPPPTGRPSPGIS